jgi:polysaccharide chain length determinant protein (PEP-CTERM system associated)
VKTKLLTTESRRATLEKQLHGDAAVSAAALTPIAGQKGAGDGVDTVSQIAAMQQHLDELLLKFTDKHPDVIAAREQLADLKRRRAAEIASLRQGDANAAVTSGASSNPVYQSIELALNQADVDISDLRTELAEHEAKAKELKEFLDTAPQIEAEYAQLSRDYDVNKAQYTALLANYDKARLGEQADNAGSVKFEIVQPPTVSFLPAWPRRTRLLIEVFLAALGVGGALAYQLNRLKPVVVSATALAQLTGVTVLGVVGSAFPSKTARSHRRQVWGVSVAIGLVVIAFVAAVLLSRSGVRASIPLLTQLLRT